MHHREDVTPLRAACQGRQQVLCASHKRLIFAVTWAYYTLAPNFLEPPQGELPENPPSTHIPLHESPGVCVCIEVGGKLGSHSRRRTAAAIAAAGGRSPGRGGGGLPGGRRVTLASGPARERPGPPRAA